MAARMMLALTVAAVVALCYVAGARQAKPRVPAGRDPGGIAVAIIGAGIDYRRPDIAARLARDGEGEPISWDFEDHDPWPFSGSDNDGPAAELLIREIPTVRLVAMRVAAGRHDQIAAALRFVGDTPARVALVLADPGASLPLAGLAEAARRLGGLLLLVPAHHVANANAASVPASADRAGLLIVSSSNNGTVVDVVVAPPPSADGAVDKLGPDDAAVIRVAALAVRLLTAEPQLAGAALRARILTLARPQPAGPAVLPGTTSTK